MKQVVRKGLGAIEVADVPAPSVPPHHIMLRPLHSLISSGTESASLHGNVAREVAENPSHIVKVLKLLEQQPPLRIAAEVRAKLSDYAVMGYAGAGMVTAHHATVTDMPVGTRVAYGGEGTGHAEFVVTGRNLVAEIPEQVSTADAAFTTLGAIALNGVRTAQLSLGDTVAVVGLGLVGQLAAQLARLQGGRVIALDLQEDRVRLAESLGAETGVLSDDGAIARVQALTGGRGADSVILCAASKSAAPAELAMRLTRDRGRIVVVGAVDLHFNWLEMYLKEIQLYLARAYGPGSYDPKYEREAIDYPFAYVRWTENRNMGDFLRLLATKQVVVDALVSHRFPLDDAPRAYETVTTPGTKSLAVLLEYPAVAETREQLLASVPERTVRVPSPATGTLRVALSGAGNIVRWAHMPSLQKVPGAVLHAVYSSNGVRGRSYANRYKAAYCTTDYQQVINDPDIDAVLVASRNQQHAPQALAALRGGKHVLVEKPMGITVDECRDLLAAERQSGKVLAVGFNRRFAPLYRDVRDRLRRRTGPAVLTCRVNSPGISGDYWMADPAIGGAILGEACHFLDLFAWMLGSEPVEISASSLPPRDTEPIGSNNVVAQLRFADGSIAALTYCTIGHPKGAGERLEVYASGIRAATADFKQIEIAGGLPRRKRLFADKGYDGQMRAFAAAARGERDADLASGIDGARASLACIQLLASAAAGGVPQRIGVQHLA